MARYRVLIYPKDGGSSRRVIVDAYSMSEAKSIAEEMFSGSRAVDAEPLDLLKEYSPHADKSNSNQQNNNISCDLGNAAGGEGLHRDGVIGIWIFFGIVLYLFFGGNDDPKKGNTHQQALGSIPQSEIDKRNTIPQSEIKKFFPNGSSFRTPVASNLDQRVVWYTMGANTDLPGNDISSKPIKTSSTEDCGQLCLNDQNCMAFTFNARAKACFIKFKKGDVSFFSGAESGYVVGR